MNGAHEDRRHKRPLRCLVVATCCTAVVAVGGGILGSRFNVVVQSYSARSWVVSGEGDALELSHHETGARVVGEPGEPVRFVGLTERVVEEVPQFVLPWRLLRLKTPKAFVVEHRLPTVGIMFQRDREEITELAVIDALEAEAIQFEPDMSALAGMGISVVRAQPSRLILLVILEVLVKLSWIALPILLLWLLMELPLRQDRIREQRCLKCGFPFEPAQNTCTECGSPIDQKTRGMSGRTPRADATSSARQ